MYVHIKPPVTPVPHAYATARQRQAAAAYHRKSDKYDPPKMKPGKKNLTPAVAAEGITVTDCRAEMVPKPVPMYDKKSGPLYTKAAPWHHAHKMLCITYRITHRPYGTPIQQGP